MRGVGEKGAGGPLSASVGVGAGHREEEIQESPPPFYRLTEFAAGL